MVETTAKAPVRNPNLPDAHRHEDLILERARLRQRPDWERLMEAGVTPELLVGADRRWHRARWGQPKG